MSTADLQLQRTQARLGAACGIAGALLALIVNPLHGDLPADPQEALAMFRLLREANLKMFAQLTPEQWDRGGVHAERGKLTVRSLCRHMAAHDINHIEQIRRILNGKR